MCHLKNISGVILRNSWSLNKWTCYCSSFAILWLRKQQQKLLCFSRQCLPSQSNSMAFSTIVSTAYVWPDEKQSESQCDRKQHNIPIIESRCPISTNYTLFLFFAAFEKWFISFFISPYNPVRIYHVDLISLYSNKV